LGQEQAQQAMDAARQEGQVGYSGGHQQLEQGFGATPVTSLTKAELDEPSQAVLDHLAAALVLPERRTGLQAAGALQQPFLWVKLDGAATLTTNAPPAERTDPADMRRKLEVRLLAAADVGADLRRRAGARAVLQVNSESGLGIAALVAHGRHFGHQPPARLLERLAGRA
jgi:hypothetical protein